MIDSFNNNLHIFYMYVVYLYKIYRLQNISITKYIDYKNHIDIVYKCI